MLSLLLTGFLLMAFESDDEFLNNGGNNSTDNPTRFYATLMIEYEEPAFIDELQQTIAPEDLYIDETNYYFGLEMEYHVTLLPYLENDVDVKELKTYLKDISEYETQLVDVSRECILRVFRLRVRTAFLPNHVAEEEVVACHATQMVGHE
jgi:hypothetical protein